MVARSPRCGGALRAGVRVERVTPRTDAALVALSDGDPGARPAGGGRGRPRQRGARGARDRRAALGLRAEGAGLHGDARRCRTRGSRPRSTARAARSRWCRSRPRRRTPRRWSGWRRGRGRRSWPRCRRRTSTAALDAARPAGCSASCGSPSPRLLWPIVAQVADRLDGPRTALVAEAAHVVPPIGAQGLNMSLADIATLVELCRAAAGGHRRAASRWRATTGRGTARCCLAARRDRRAEPRGDGRGAAAARPAPRRAEGAPRRPRRSGGR